MPDLPEDVKGIFKEMVKTYKDLQKKARELTKKIEAFTQGDEFCQKIRKIPGLGPISSAGLKVAIGDIARFPSPRTLPAYFGLVPRNITTGHSLKMGKITKRGDKLVRTYLVQAASSLLMLDGKGKSAPALDTAKTSNPQSWETCSSLSGQTAANCLGHFVQE